MEPDTHNSAPPLILEADATIETKKLTIAYVVQNVSTSTYLLIDALHRISNGTHKYDPALAFASVRLPTTLEIKRIFPPLPRAFDVAVGYAPWVRVVTPGHKLSGHIVKEIPVQEYNPYFRYDGPTKIVTIKHIALEIQYALLRPPGEVRPIPMLDGVGMGFNLAGTEFGKLHAHWDVEALACEYRLDERPPFERI
jgi:hypothetical protein